MTGAALIRGWCPTAWRPMAAGDGLLLRVRPRLGRLTREQALALCAVARDHGNGEIDLTNRGGLQLRGIGTDWEPAVAALVVAGLVDADPAREAAPAMLLSPDWREGDDTHRIALAMIAALPSLPLLPGKVGIAIDAGDAAVLTASPADFRIERAAGGALILRADGRPTGMVLAPGGEAAALIALMRWFVETGGAEAGRMARHRAPLPTWAAGDAAPLVGRPVAIGPHPLGQAIGLPFGRIDADRLEGIVRSAGTRAVRVTPWRILIAEGGGAGLDPGDAALLGVDACVGAPACPQATVETRALAMRLAPCLSGSLHVAGCAKGCARARPADTVLTGRDGRYDLAFAATAGSLPAAAGLTADQLLARFQG